MTEEMQPEGLRHAKLSQAYSLENNALATQGVALGYVVRPLRGQEGLTAQTVFDLQRQSTKVREHHTRTGVFVAAASGVATSARFRCFGPLRIAPMNVYRTNHS
jgi:hypothetical protein